MAGVGEVRVWATFSDPSVLAGWRDLRVEAWPATAPWGLAVVDPSARAPFATGPAGWSPPDGSPEGSPSTALSGTLRLDHSPGAQWEYMAITGLAPDGQSRRARAARRPGRSSVP